MSEAFIVRAATLGDYEGMCTLLAAVDELHRLNVPWMFRKPTTEPRSKDHFDRLLVGVATTLLRNAPDFGIFVTQRWGVLDNVAVLESWRRRGVGTSLVRDAERWVQSRGGKWIELGVYEFNDEARAFYQALGYSPVSTKLRKPFDQGESS